jgi:hypothetical protein
LRVATFYAEGVQKYKSQAKAGSSPVTYEWVFVAPQGFFMTQPIKVGTHSAGPTWQLLELQILFMDNNTVLPGQPNPDANNIDWLNLMLKKLPLGDLPM